MGDHLLAINEYPVTDLRSLKAIVQGVTVSKEEFIHLYLQCGKIVVVDIATILAESNSQEDLANRVQHTYVNTTDCVKRPKRINPKNSM